MEVYVGQFNEDELRSGIDKRKVAEAMEEYQLKYTRTKFVKKKGEIVGLKIWVTDVFDIDLNPPF